MNSFLSPFLKESPTKPLGIKIKPLTPDSCLLSISDRTFQVLVFFSLSVSAEISVRIKPKIEIFVSLPSNGKQLLNLFQKNTFALRVVGVQTHDLCSVITTRKYFLVESDFSNSFGFWFRFQCALSFGFGFSFGSD